MWRLNVQSPHTKMRHTPNWDKRWFSEMVFAHQIETVLFGDVLVFFRYKIIGNKVFHTKNGESSRIFFHTPNWDTHQIETKSSLRSPHTKLRRLNLVCALCTRGNCCTSFEVMRLFNTQHRVTKFELFCYIFLRTRRHESSQNVTFSCPQEQVKK